MAHVISITCLNKSILLMHPLYIPLTPLSHFYYQWYPGGEGYLAYLKSVPRLYFNGGSFHAFRRRVISSSETSRSMTRREAEMVILSPSCTRAIGPPACASGTIWPIR
jgi:hypothetical protein